MQLIDEIAWQKYCYAVNIVTLKRTPVGGASRCTDIVFFQHLARIQKVTRPPLNLRVLNLKGNGFAEAKKLTLNI
jgi:hypothetical protein